MRKSPDKFFVPLISVALVLVTAAAYQQIRMAGFVNLDDPVYVAKNAHVLNGFSVESVKWAFTTDATANWHPLTWLSLMLDCQLFKSKAAACHTTNLIFHIANTLLLFWFLKKVTSSLWPSAFVAAAFALHPLHVESVAWVSERKDVLSVFFWLLTFFAYINYAKSKSVSRYLLVIVLFALGLMSKPMLVTLPFTLLLLDYWPLQRFDILTGKGVHKNNARLSNLVYPKVSLLQLIIEKLPLLALTVISCLITYFVQQGKGAFSIFGFGIRLANALASYGTYIFKMFYPVHLAVLYLHPGSSVAVWKSVLSLAILVCVTVLIFRTISKRRYLLTGWLWYLGTLVPVIGLVQVGQQSMADRYTYVPLIGLFIIIAFGVDDVLSKLKFPKPLVVLFSVLVIAGMFIGTYLQVRYWRNDFTLFGRAAKVTKNNYVMLNNFAWSLATAEEPEICNSDEALKYALTACELTSYKKADTLDTLAAAYAAGGNFSRAITIVKRALLIIQISGHVNDEVVQEVRSRLELYKKGRRYTEPPLN